MENSAAVNYKRIEKAIAFISTNFERQPSLEEIAEQVHLSPFHFQRLFTEWAGTTPKRFLQYISMQYAKEILSKERATLWEATQATGLSSTSRLHDLFIQLEGMTPAEYKQGGKNLHIEYRVDNTPFGEVLIATTWKGICYLSFIEHNLEKSLQALIAKFPEATFTAGRNEMQDQALRIFHHDWADMPQIKLHLKGTDFQLKVWQCLLEIPKGSLCSYGQIAHEIGTPLASRAVGTAIGSNPVAYLIPCHRVIQSAGGIGGYMWGINRKKAIIGWEAAKKQ
ncbi:methylated-DNA--[protein]-cysteine S-methyltransferase [Sphingobacterium sp. lm-10]|uniref:methylated-DNA--[protein]-cysteine S-methyltransferase n=1 Tax=Sphingobacterium sp. lm-10 TaxID=2944904 RepID=UPI0020227F9B|nr:methylated-DNA--[protein]-cysteine S-methyltransferase [Sphingobacterium sp. lm-10]MCL7987788.1 methylated-DNA--[protein]-cysteine S-methyltransferase [Sphingobacterium sp. lm-10]